MSKIQHFINLLTFNELSKASPLQSQFKYFKFEYFVHSKEQKMNERLQKFVAKAIPLTIYLQSISTIIITKGLANIEEPPPLVTSLYYVYLATIYGVQILRVLLTKFLHGYSRGFWIHTLTIVQFVIHFVIIVGALAYQNEQPYSYWIVWELVVFILAWGSTMSLRLAFILLISFRVFNRKGDQINIKETYWLTLTTKDELFANQGKLCHDPHETAQSHLRTLIGSEHLQNQ